MTAAILNHAGLDPTVVVGGRTATMGGSNARVGKSDLLVVESDESDGSFLKLAPILAVVTNIDREHLDHYADIEAIRAAFLEFVNKVPFYGAAILCLDDENVQQILPRVNRRTITYGESPQAQLQVHGYTCGHLSSRFSVRGPDGELGEFHLNVPGFHNVLNATAALAIGAGTGSGCGEGAAGAGRLQRRGPAFPEARRGAGITVVDDYGHHPTEIRATLAAARQCDYTRVLVIFQPHRYTRTQHLMDEFARSFHQADGVFLLDIYAASEKPIEGVSAETLAERIRQFGHRWVEYSGTIDKAVEAVRKAAQPGDLVLTLGAGNVWQAGDRLLQQLKGGG